MDTIDLVDELIRNNQDVDLFTFSKYPMQTLVQGRAGLRKADEEHINNAIDIRNKLRLPFWDALMLSIFDKDDVSEALISSALNHNPNVKIIRTREMGEVRSFIDLNKQDNISLNSEVFFKNQIVKHLFMLDFHIYPSKNNLSIVCQVLDALALHGYILNSGESYHFVSDSFFDKEQLIDLLAKSLLFSPIVDRAWIAHQILERSCSLRVGVKHNITPTLIKKI